MYHKPTQIKSVQGLEKEELSNGPDAEKYYRPAGCKSVAQGHETTESSNGSDVDMFPIPTECKSVQGQETKESSNGLDVEMHHKQTQIKSVQDLETKAESCNRHSAGVDNVLVGKYDSVGKHDIEEKTECNR